MDKKIEIPDIPEEELTPTVKKLLDVISQCVQAIEQQNILIRQLKDENARLKGGNPRPKLKPSTLERNNIDSTDNDKKTDYKSGNKRKKKKKKLKVTNKKKLKKPKVPKGSKFKGYTSFFVQDIEIKPKVTEYIRQDWETPDGKRVLSPLPPGIAGHYGSHLRQYILNLNYSLNVPHRSIKEHLDEIGFDISAGQLNSLLLDGHHIFHQEKEELLETGLKHFPYVAVDDTGARHKEQNGFCTYIGNNFFTYFESTKSKSRINFLELLRGKDTNYIFTQESLVYMEQKGITGCHLKRFKGLIGRKIENNDKWLKFLKTIGFPNKKEKRIFTEAALLGSILEKGIPPDLTIVSDDAGQFDILFRALCWMHAERKITTLTPINDYESNIIDDIRTEIWAFYNALKIYKLLPGETMKKALERKFEKIFTQKTEFETINKALSLIHATRKGILMVLEKPGIPLHNNESENSIRSMVRKRKIHGGTRSETGKKCRDTFISLKKTCLKLGIPFYKFLHDRLTEKNEILPLYRLMLEKSSI